MVNIIYGRLGTGKTDFMIDQIKHLDKDKKIYWVVPEQYTYENERMLLDRLSVNGMMHIQVVSLQRFASMIASKTALKHKTMLTQEGKGLIVKRVIDELSPSLSVFKGVADKYGFLDHVTQFLEELKKNTITVEQITALAETGTPSAMKDKLSDIHKIYSRYNEILSDSYIDQHDLLISCCQNLSANQIISDACFFFDGFHSFDRSSYVFMEFLMRYAEECTFTLTYDTEDYFAVTADTFAKIRQCAENAGKDFNAVCLRKHQTAAMDLLFLEQHFLGYEDVRFNAEASSVELYCADSIYSEVENTAASINRFVRLNGWRFSDVAVITADMELYSPIIEEVFETYDIPIFMDKRKEIIFSSPIKAFLFLISMADKTYSTYEILAYAKTGFSDIADEDTQIIENYVLEFGIKGTMWEKTFVRNNTEKGYDLEQINDIRKRLINPVLQMRETVKSYENTAEFCEKLYGYLNVSGFNAKITALVNRFSENEDFEAANTYAQIYNKIILILDQAHDFFGEDKIDPEQLHDMFAYAFVSSSVGVIPSAIDRVSIGDILRTRGGKVKAIFILGANEGMLPSSESDTGLFTDEEKQMMRLNGIELIDTSAYKRQKELFLIYTLLCKPSEKSILSRFIKDRDGEDHEASFIFERIRDIMPESQADDQFSQIDRLIDPNGAFYRLAENLSERIYESGHEERFDSIYDDVYLYYNEQEAWQAQMQALRDGLRFDNGEEIKDIVQYEAAIREPLIASITMLEKYAACPFSFFAQYLIKPQERREQSIRNTDIGSVLHKIVEVYSTMILEKKIEPSAVEAGELSDIVAGITESVLGEYSSGLFAQISKSRYLKVKLLRAAESAVAEITRQLNISDFLLTETEAKFRFHEKYQPICVDIDGYKKVYVQGIIDRIDTYEFAGRKYAKIIDYKTGAREFDISKAYYGLSLQLPVYMKAELDNAEEPMNAAGVFYFRIKSPLVRITKDTDEDSIKELIRKDFQLKGITVKNLDIIHAMDKNASDNSFIANVSVKKDGSLKENNTLIDAETFYALLHKTQYNIANTAKNILSGKADITPYRYNTKEIPCTYCKFKGFCKFSEEFSANRYINLRKQKSEEMFDKIKKEHEADSGQTE